MTVFNEPIRKLAKANTDFRREVATGVHAQVVLMCLQPGDDIGGEVHAGTDQLFQVVKGEAEAVLDGASHALRKGSMLLVPAGVRHNLRNSGGKRLRLVTVYAPPQHAAGTVHATRADALQAGQGKVLPPPRAAAAAAGAARPRRAR